MPITMHRCEQGYRSGSGAYDEEEMAMKAIFNG
jgi:hypothetical protein